ncbi:3-phosphoshikimate 1-carboxyvinyltransferase [Weissella beninensis]|uniref:3-phosphoshikimate 1-carboxyvinyltransferase n=1 Tax=Periweissella beninensis TaxID=504936 RepID=A0ABT0VGS5_9LACO|nr:3-phosphoshikimate 1-carboxyvinyltransferase [Periweissella beninensis]MBM7543755.1 3-phosphoshikimate 1-carboxyvinyltransferase [Periweissella beninensis]MCM2436861.1 3-phosphoshikimate 1-carboxyvinyltransferase [Periweissella beninensis]
MQEIRQNTTGLAGTIRVPSDKSISHRALILALLAKGTTTINHRLISADVTATMTAIQKLGANVIENDDHTITKVVSEGRTMLINKSQALVAFDFANSGTTTRLLTGVLAGTGIKAKITGDTSLSTRPMQRVIKPLTTFGAQIDSNNNHLPLIINTPITADKLLFELPLGSAQVKNAVLLAGLASGKAVEISDKFKTRDHTERMLPAFGGEITINDDRITLPADQNLVGTTVDVPGDISAAAFWLVAASLVDNSEVTLTSVNVNPTRAGILAVLERMGANLSFKISAIGKEPVADITVKTTKHLQATTISAQEVPSLIDELPIIVLAATQATGTTIITGASELRVKESNRIDLVTTELTKLGADITATTDGFIIKGPTKLQVNEPVTLNGHGDHRLTMMLAIAGLINKGVVTLADTDNVAVSYPTFFQDLRRLTK